MPSDAALDAAAAAKEATTPPPAVLHGTPIGVCPDCGERFKYGIGTDITNLDPCPECGSRQWEKLGVRYQDKIHTDPWEDYR